MNKLFRFLAIGAMAFPFLFACEGVDETVPVSSVELSKTSLDLAEGEEATLTATVKPSDATDKSVSWRSSDETVVSVNNGRVKALKPGNATVTATAGGKSATCSVRVSQRTVAVTAIHLDKDSLDLTEGDEATLTATVEPADATDKTVTWASTDTKIATVANGKVTAVKEGTATITAKAGGKTATCVVTVDKRFITVTSIELDKTSLELTEGDEAVLTATVKPDDATDKTVEWISSASSVATVTDGKVKALRPGTTIITAQAGGKTAQCTVTVKAKVVPVTSIQLDKTTLTLTEGDEATLAATVKPDNATDKTVTWTTSDATVATVADGKVTAVKEGTATITAKAGDKTATCTVTVKAKVIPVTSMWLDKAELELTEGEEATLIATVMPENATDKTVTWSSSNTSVATVTDGKVKALKAGTATITAKAGDKSAKCSVTVLPSFIAVTSVTLDKGTLGLVEGDQAVLTATVSPDNATDPTVTWTTSNASVATVEDGMVTAVKAGTATITAKAGEKSAQCTVSVSQGIIPVESITLDKSEVVVTEGDEFVLTATVKPDNATDPTVTWVSNDPSVATVTDGKVKALKEGAATIFAYAGEKRAQCVVVVNAFVHVSFIVLDKSALELVEGEEATLTATVLPDYASDKTVTWTTSDASVATVTDGRVKALKAGTAVITAKAGDKTATCTVTVKPSFIPVTSIWLDKSEVVLTEGDEYVLTVTVKPDDATDKTVTWSTSDASVATVTDGRVKALKAGTAVITAKVGDKTAICTVTVKPSFIPVESITLDKTELTLLEWTQSQLTVTVKPDDATDKTVTWTTSDIQVAEADKNGIVYAHYPGTAVLTAKAGDKTATCTVTVEAKFIPVEWIGLSHPSLVMEVGQEVQISAAVKPDDATDKTVTWTSSDETLATVTDGLVKALKAGNVVITAKAGDKTAECPVRIDNPSGTYIPVESVTLDKTSLEVTEAGEFTLIATVEPENATDNVVYWSSSDETIARISNGKGQALRPGSVVITARAGDKSATCTVTVLPRTIPVNAITLDHTSLTLTVGKGANLVAYIDPPDATDQTVIWTSSNAAVATVDEGWVTGVKAGNATITAKAGDKTATCAVTVVAKPVINLPKSSTDIGGHVKTPGTFTYSISNPIAGETLHAYTTEFWLTVDEVTASEVRFHVEENRTGADRTGVLRIEYKDAEPKTFMVHQYDWDYDWTTVTISPATVTAPAAGQTYTVSYTIENPVEGYPLSWSVLPYSCHWITSISSHANDLHSGTLTFTVQENPDQTARGAQIEVGSRATSHPTYIQVSQAGQTGEPDIDMGGRDLSWDYSLNPYGGEASFYAAVVNPVEGTRLKISADVPWMTNFRDDPDGCHHYFTVPANNTGSLRRGNVTLTYGSITKVIHYVQEPAIPEIILTPDNATFDYRGRTVTFDISLPDGADYDKLQVTTSSTRFIKNIQRSGRKVTFELKENNDGSDRTAEIDVTYDSTKAVFHLTQTYSAPVYHIYPSTSITVGYADADHPMDIQVDNQREQTSLSLLNLDAPGWITCRTVDGVPVFHVYQNSTGASRSTRIRVGYFTTAQDYVDVTVTQTTASTAIHVTPDKIECGAAGTTQTLTFSITDPLTGVSMTATPGKPWIKVNSVNNTSASVTILKNLANTARTSSITFYYGSYSVVVPVTQQGNTTPAGFVDLGLPSGTLWAEGNVGAASDYEAGSFFAWAEKTAKSTFNWNNYLWGTESNLTKYNSTDKKTSVELADDPAYQANPSWTLPTKAQFEELVSNTDHEWVDEPPYRGMKFKSKVGDTYIFLPAAGFIEIEPDGEWGGYYWSKDLNTSKRSQAHSLLIWSDGQAFTSPMDRCAGMLVRAVKK